MDANPYSTLPGFIQLSNEIKAQATMDTQRIEESVDEDELADARRNMINIQTRGIYEKKSRRGGSPIMPPQAEGL